MPKKRLVIVPEDVESITKFLELNTQFFKAAAVRQIYADLVHLKSLLNKCGD